MRVRGGMLALLVFDRNRGTSELNPPWIVDSQPKDDNNDGDDDVGNWKKSSSLLPLENDIVVAIRVMEFRCIDDDFA